ncbi:MAG: sugar ABC transporter substrate-binding protein [Proteobacteria bacterium]|nr:sugar ABC transporter substrate-binding protein [Burkholderiales bacterium]
MAVFTKNRSNPAYEAARIGADRAAAAFGAVTTHHVPAVADDVAQQIALVHEVLAAPPDGIVFVPVHETEVNAAIESITAAGIPIANPIARMTAGQPLTFVGSDNEALAFDVARYLLRHIGGCGRVLMLEGIAASATTAPRTRGFLVALAEFPEVRLIGRLTGDYQRGVARTAVSDWLDARADRGAPLDAVLAANDVMALGALDALSGRGWQVPVIGINALPEAIDAIRSGQLLATVDFDAMKIAHIATEALLRHLRGERVPKEITLPVQIVDRSNFAAWDRPLAQRDCLRWEDVVARA